MTWEPVEREVQFWSEFCFNRFSGSAMKWPRSSSACGAGRWNLFLRSSFPHRPPPPPPPATRVAVPPGVNMLLDPPIAPSNYSPLAHQGISWVGSKWDIFGWKIVRLSGRCFVRGKSECDYDTRAPEIQIDPPKPCWCFPCDSQENSILTKRPFVK